MRGAIFDMDGTLLDSMGVWESITEMFFEKHNIEYDKSCAERFREMTLTESSQYISRRFLPELCAEQISNELNALAAHEYISSIPLKPYAAQYLRQLSERGVKLAIATSGFSDLCIAALKRLGVWDLFDAIALSSEVGVNKSNPDVYLLAAERIGTAPHECTVYEDILQGITGAKKAGMRTVGVYDKSADADAQNIKAAADVYIKSWQELLED